MGGGEGGVAVGAKVAATESQISIGAAAANDTVRWVYNTANNTLSYDADGDGGTAAIQVAAFQNVTGVGGGVTAATVASAIAYIDSSDAATYLNSATLAPTAPANWS